MKFSLQTLLVSLLNLYSYNVLAQMPAPSTTLHLVAGASPTDPMVAPMAAGAASVEGQSGMGMGMGMGMASASGAASYDGAKGGRPGAAQPSGMAGESPRGSGGMNSTGASSGSEGSPAGAQALPDVPTDIPSPVIQSDPTFTLPVVIQSGNAVPQAATPQGEGNPPAQAGSAPQAQAAGNNISQAEASGTNNAASSSAKSWGIVCFNKEKALFGAAISASLLYFL